MSAAPISVSTHANTIRSQVDRWEHKLDGPHPIDRLSALSLLEQTVRHEIDKAAVDAHNAGMSWANIGKAFGITRQSAHVKWGKPGTADAP